MTANINSLNAIAPSINPLMSSFRPLGLELSGSIKSPAINATTPKIALNAKTPRQLVKPMMTPPIIGPKARAIPDTAAQTPRARDLFALFG